jgi:hypothetical protein
VTVGIGRRHTPCPSATTGMLPHFELSRQVNLVGFLITSGAIFVKNEHPPESFLFWRPTPPRSVAWSYNVWANVPTLVVGAALGLNRS